MTAVRHLAQLHDAVPPKPEAAALEAWRVPPTRWMDVALEQAAEEYLSPPRAARSYALLAVGMNDALVLAEKAQSQGAGVSDDAALAVVAEVVLSYSHPLRAEQFQQLAAEARWVGVWQGRDTPEAARRGEQLGRRVADAVLSWARHDGADTFAAFSEPAPKPGVWRPTPPHLWSALEPGWGSVRPIALPSAAAMAAPAPPAWDSPAFTADRTAFLAAQQQLSAEETQLAERWAGGMGSVTPAGLWLGQARRLIERDGLGSREAATVYAHLAVAMHDAFIACWASKYRFLVERPITWMREHEPGWSSPLETPPFPSYPSGHATASGAASVVLAGFFPADAETLAATAEEAARSRVLGGVHWPLDSRAGLEQGRRIGRWLLDNLDQDSVASRAPK